MALIEITNQESKTYLTSLMGDEDCYFRISRHIKLPDKVRFFLNTNDQKESVCMGNCASLPVCRKCGIYSSQLPITASVVPMSNRKNGIS